MPDTAAQAGSSEVPHGKSWKRGKAAALELANKQEAAALAAVAAAEAAAATEAERLIYRELDHFRLEGQGLSQVTVREPTHFTILALDTNEKPVNRGGESFFIAIRGVAHVRARVEDHEDGTYTVRWQPTQSGQYHICVSHFGEPIPGSPFTVRAAPPEPRAARCELSGDALTQATAREMHTFSIAFRDAAGTTTRAVDLDVFLEPVPLGSPRNRSTGSMPDADSSSPATSTVRYLPEPVGEDDASPNKGSSSASYGLRAIDEQSHSAEGDSPTTGGNGSMSTPTTQRRGRCIRVKVGKAPLLVRATADLDSAILGQLLPGSVATVIEERISSDSNVRACVALDYLIKLDDDGVPTERGQTFRNSASHRSSRSHRTAVARVQTTAAKVDSPQGTLITPALPPNGRRTPAHLNSPKPRAARRRVVDDDSGGSSGSVATGSVTEPSGRVSFRPDACDATPSTCIRVAAAEGWSGALSPTWPKNAPTVGASHDRVQERMGFNLPTDITAPEAPSRPVLRRATTMPLPARAVSAEEFIAQNEEDASSQEPVTSGWITLVKGGVKLVTSRLRLDAGTRRQHHEQWSRRLAHDRLLERTETELHLRLKELGSNRNRVASKLRDSHQGQLRASSSTFAVELSTAERASDAAAFAFGGVWPGKLHARGHLPETHRVSYSVGVTGQYLLHVRLRKQAASLPGSPFLLTVVPGTAYHLSTVLPKVVHGEVSGRCSLVITTGDRMGNDCIIGGGAVTCPCPHEGIVAQCVDRGDGSYEITWTSTRTGSFDVAVKVDDVHVVNSPMPIRLKSTIPDYAKTIVEGGGLKTAVKGVHSSFRLKFRDCFGNSTTQTQEFRDAFEAGMALTAQGITHISAKSRHAFEGLWIDDDDGRGYAEYQLSYEPAVAGGYSLWLWVESSNGERTMMPDSPYAIAVHANASDQVNVSMPQQEIVSASGTTAGDYKVSRSVFDDAQRRWGECSVDAFSSAATSFCQRFWTAKNVVGSDGTNAFKQQWKLGDRIWAHPPPSRLGDLAALLQSKERESEAIVCAPFRPTNDWFYQLTKLADESQKIMAGKLQRVADDAPSRIEEWPIMLFHIPAQPGEPRKRMLKRAKTMPDLSQVDTQDDSDGDHNGGGGCGG